MKRLSGFFSALVLCAVLLSSFTAFAENTSYELDELNMSVAVPNDMLVITRESEKTDSYFSKFGVDYKETMNELKEGDIYLYALKEDNSLSLTVTMTKNEDSKKIDSYSKLSDDELSDIKDELLTSKAYKTASVVEANGTKYILLTMSTKSGKKIIQAQQYNTVVNGENIIITMQAAAGKKLTTDNKELFASIIEGTTIIEVNFFSQNQDLIIYGGATLLGVIIVAVVLILLLKHFRSPNRRHKHLVHELAHEHRITETTRLPRKTIFNITKPTQSFLENYDPIEEIGAEPKKRRKKTAAAETKGAKTVSEPVREDTLQSLDEILPAPEPQNVPSAEKPKPEDDLYLAVEAAIEASQAEPEQAPSADEQSTQEIAGEILSSAIDEDFEDKVDDAIEENLRQQNIETVEPQPEEDFEDVSDYFDDVPEEELYSYTDVNEAVDDYRPARRAQEYESEDDLPAQSFGENASRVLKKTGHIIAVIAVALGKGIAKVASTVWTVLVFIVIHCKYFCINLYRLIRRKHNMRKRRKIEEERRRQQSERRRIEREAQRARQRQNAARGENDLVKVHSQGERRPVNRNARPQQRTAYPRSQYQNRRPRR